VIVGSFGTLFIKVKVMTENTPKKPRRKRRTKAEIAAEKAALAAKEVEPGKEVKTDDVIVEMLEESVASEEAVKEEIVESAPKPASEPLEPYVPQTGLDKLRKKLGQRKLRDQYYNEWHKKNE
jgi:hypothetical protein